jgi:hypothetical protein
LPAREAEARRRQEINQQHLDTVAENFANWTDDSALKKMLYALVELRDDIEAGYKPDIAALSATIAKVKGEAL